MYIPDYRKETDKLNEKDRAYINGYRAAMEEVDTFFGNLDVYDLDDEKMTTPEEVKEAMRDWLRMGEKEVVLSLFERAEYLPDDIELVDAAKPFAR